MGKVVNWISDHDNKRVFIILYISLSLILSIAISLFWLLIAVLVHFVFELIGQWGKRENTKAIILESVWETKLDFALVVFALWLAIYLDFIFGVAGIGAAARVGAQTASRTGQLGGKALQSSARIAAWSRIIRAVLLSLDDVGNALKAIYQSKESKKRKASIAAESGNIRPSLKITNKKDIRSSWGTKWQIIDYVGILLFCVSLLLIILAPILVGTSPSAIYDIVTEEFHPFP